MTSLVTDCEPESLAIEDKNGRLRKQLEEVVHKCREIMTALLQEQASIRMLEQKIERTLKSLEKRRVAFEAELIQTSHAFDKLMRQF